MGLSKSTPFWNSPFMMMWKRVEIRLSSVFRVGMASLLGLSAYPYVVPTSIQFSANSDEPKKNTSMTRDLLTAGISPAAGSTISSTSNNALKLRPLKRDLRFSTRLMFHITTSLSSYSKRAPTPRR